MGDILKVVLAVLAIAVGIWKFFASRSAAIKARQQAGADKVKEEIAENDTSKITEGFSDINNK